MDINLVYLFVNINVKLDPLLGVYLIDEFAQVSIDIGIFTPGFGKST